MLGRIRRRRAVKARGDFFGQRHLGIFGVAPASNLGLERGNLGQAFERQQRVPVPHQRVGDRQHLGKHGVGVFGNADVVVFRLGHFLHAVQPDQQRHGQHALRLLAVFLLQVTPHQQVKFLVGAAQLQVGLERHRVVALHQRVQKFMHGNRRAGLEAVVKIVALHHPRHGKFGRQLDHAGRAQRLTPFAVVANLGLGRIEHQTGLLVIGFGVELDLLGRQRRARVVAPGRVANQAGEVANQKDDLVAEVLQLAHFVQHHGVADVDIGRGRVQPQLDAQRLAAGLRARQLLHPLVLRQQLLHAAQRDFQRLLNGIGGH